MIFSWGGLKDTNDELSLSNERLSSILTQLNQLYEGGPIDLTADTIGQLQDTKATIQNWLTDFPDLTTHDKLDEVLGEVGDNGTLLEAILTALGSLTVTATLTETDFPDAAANTKLASILTALGTLSISVSNFPTNYPDSTTHTKLDTLHTDLTAGGQKTQVTNFPATQAVSAASLPLPTNAAQETGGNLATVVTDLGHLTDGTQQTKITDGTNIATVVAGDSNSVLTGVATKTTSYAISSTGVLFTIDAEGYSWATVEFEGTGTGTFAPYSHSDATGVVRGFGAPYLATHASAPTWATPAGATNISISAGAQYAVEFTGRYFSLTIQTKPTLMTATVTLHTGVPPIAPSVGVYQDTSPWVVSGSVSQGTGQGTSPWTVSGKVPVTSLNAVVVTGVGTALDCTGAMPNPTMQVHTTGTVSTISINLEGSNNGTNWVVLATSTSVISADYTVIPDSTHVGVSMREYRANITILTGVAETVTALVSAGG